MENLILNMYFTDKKKQIEIANLLGISKYKVSRVVSKDERYKQEKENRKQSNRKRNIEFTKKYINETRKHKNNEMDYAILEKAHREASIELSQPRRLSNMSYRNWNISAFSFNHKRNGFEFRKELGRSADVPKFIKNEV